MAPFKKLLCRKGKEDVPASIQLTTQSSEEGTEDNDNDFSMSSPSETNLQLEALKRTMGSMERTINEQNVQMQQIMSQQSAQMEFVVKTLTWDEEHDENADAGPEPIDCGTYEIVHGNTTWHVAGVSCRQPDPDHVYFPGLAYSATGPNERPNDKIISAIIPCYNEERTDLERTIRGLSRQIMPEGWRVEVVIVMDGASSMSQSMADYLSEMFGVHFKPEDPKQDPFQVLPQARTIVVHPLHKQAADTRWPVIEGTMGGFSLVVKKENRRKANSQQWWLGPHSTAIGCKYALATDCGTYFERKTLEKLIVRLDDELNTHAVTGTQATMPADIQGDGNFEMCHHPFGFILRMLQRFEFEVDNVSFMSIYDSIGAMHVIPGPCGLYRYSKLGSLKEGLMSQYFHLFSRSNKGLILGNVELVEDRIPGTLLVFPPKQSSKHDNIMPVEGWPKTGLVRDAVFYMEAEKPLSQLVKQRRRWLNGTFATYVWMLQDGIISNSNQDPISKSLSWCLVALGVFQGLVVRMFGPALIIVWMFRFGLFIPDLIADPSRVFDPDLSLRAVETEPGRLLDGILFGGIYWVLYIAFVIGHVPRAKPVNEELSMVRYTEPSRYRSDSRSAYRGWLFLPVLWINLVTVILYILNAAGIVWQLGWKDTPLVVRVLISFCFLPFAAGLLDGIVRCNFRGLRSMVMSAPFAVPLMIWFTIWLPAYATTRLSDLTWGNRQSNSLDELSDTALKRADNGQKVARFLICFNTSVAFIIIGLMQFSGLVFPIFILTYTMILSSTYLISFFEIGYRLVNLIFGAARLTRVEEEQCTAGDSYGGCTDMYEQMDEKMDEKSVSDEKTVNSDSSGTTSSPNKFCGVW